jgi:hypothetical protein
MGALKLLRIWLRLRHPESLSTLAIQEVLLHESVGRRVTWSDVMILKIFSPKNSAKKLAFFTQN